MGSRDYRPTPNGNATFQPKCSFYCREKAQAFGLYLEQVTGAVLKNVTIQFPSAGAKQPWMGGCLAMDPITAASGVAGANDIRCING
jgi:hypothetical protein